MYIDVCKETNVTEWLDFRGVPSEPDPSFLSGQLGKAVLEQYIPTFQGTPRQWTGGKEAIFPLKYRAC